MLAALLASTFLLLASHNAEGISPGDLVMFQVGCYEETDLLEIVDVHTKKGREAASARLAEKGRAEKCFNTYGSDITYAGVAMELIMSASSVTSEGSTLVIESWAILRPDGNTVYIPHFIVSTDVKA